MSHRAISVLFGIILTLPLCADPICGSGNLSGLIGTTCDIGPLEFTFTGVSGNQNSAVTPLVPWTASEFSFTTLSNGFSLSLVASGGTSVTGPGTDKFANDIATLNYNVTDPAGTITGETVNGAGFSGTGDSFSQGGVSGETFCSPSCGSNLVFSNILTRDAFGLPIPQEGPAGLCAGFTCTGMFGSPFSSGTGTADIFNLSASGTNTMSWDGNTPSTFTFTTGPLSGVPEPSYVWFMLSIGLLGLLYAALKVRSPQCRR